MAVMGNSFSASSNFWVTGLIAAVFTPMFDDGTLNLGIVETLVEQLILDGVSGIYVCGSTGEGHSLMIHERKDVATAYIRAVNRRIPVIVQVGHESLSEASNLARHAQESGADAISAIPPLYFKPSSLDNLIDCLEQICRFSPGMPFYYYHIPRLTGLRLDMIEFLRRSERRFPALKGVKFSDYKIFELQACVEWDGGRYNILFGSDEMLFAGLVGGAHGAVGTTYNFAAPLYTGILEAVRTNNMIQAQRLQSLSIRMVNVINRFATERTNLPAMKAMMRLIGLDCGPLRLPLTNLNDVELRLLENEMQAIGFFDWGRRLK